jgi:hypothetical protein
MQRVSVTFLIAVLAVAAGAGALAAGARTGAVVAQDDDTFALGEGRFEIEGRPAA